ncbi:MAG: alpha/beta fold hydrolase [Deinococcales bacterium]
MSRLPILLIHGHTLDSRMWQPQISEFGHCIAPTLRGYGQSQPPEGAFSYCADIVSNLEPEQVHLVGLSLGGNIALEMAILHPERVASLTLLDSSLKGFTPDAAQLEIGNQVAAAYATGGIAAAKQAWLAAPLFATTRENPVLFAQVEQWIADYSGWHWQRGVSPSAAITDISSRLHEVRAKTLVVVGERDTDYFQNVARYLHGNIAGAQLEVVGQAGHLVNLEQPAQTNQLLEAHWLKAES